MNQKKLLFTDLDGTLLDLQTYSCEQVGASVSQLKDAGISIVFCSSKTWEEQEHYLNELKLDEPVIVENGSGIIFPKRDEFFHFWDTEAHGRYAKVLGKAYDEILKAVKDTSDKYYPGLKYYAISSLEEISEITKLDLEAARKAKSRDFSETIFNADLDSIEYLHFENALNSIGFQCIPGSKYVTITGHDSDKGNAVEYLIGLYKQQFEKVVSYGAGDSLNDLSMLEVVDFPYLVQKPDRSWVDCPLSKITKVQGIGPAGWNMLAKEVLNQ